MPLISTIAIAIPTSFLSLTSPLIKLMTSFTRLLLREARITTDAAASTRCVLSANFDMLIVMASTSEARI